ncbi:hypothetical protein NT6N_31470 [Oceaniferula spumae]|uniref:GYF domain-containing protein n=1 Tax=Oceaniferula spumae TaxID=2979115 RepID=A0AAT9FPN6_9BACT
MNDNTQWHYTDRTGAQAGPVSTAELQQLIAKGMAPNTGMVWKAGMPDWVMHSQVPELQVQPALATPAPQAAPVAQAAAQTPEVNPYSPPQAAAQAGFENSAFSTDMPKVYGGIGRLSLFLQTILYVLGCVIAGVVIGLIGAPFLIFVVILVALIMVIRLSCLRLKNLGMNGWWVLLIFVPIVNSFFNIMLLSCPQGYSDTRKMDTVGIIVAVILVTIQIGSFFLGGDDAATADAMRELFQ